MATSVVFLFFYTNSIQQIDKIIQQIIAGENGEADVTKGNHETMKQWNNKTTTDSLQNKNNNRFDNIIK